MPNTDSPHWQEITPSNEPISYAVPTPDLNESAAKNPEQIVETQDEILLRERCEQLYYQSGGGFSSLSKYAAGWIAAKAHYQPKQ